MRELLRALGRQQAESELGGSADGIARAVIHLGTIRRGGHFVLHRVYLILVLLLHLLATVAAQAALLEQVCYAEGLKFTGKDNMLYSFHGLIGYKHFSDCCIYYSIYCVYYSKILRRDRSGVDRQLSFSKFSSTIMYKSGSKFEDLQNMH